MTQQGECKFCHQQRQIIVGKEVSEEEANEIATNECNCDDAKAWQTKRDAVHTAEAWIEAQEFPRNIENFFKLAVNRCTDESFDQVTIKRGIVTYTIKPGTKGVRIQQKETISKAMDF